MRKYLIIFICILFLVGCGKKEEINNNNDIKKTDDINEVKKNDGINNVNETVDLYSDSQKIVFADGTTLLVYYYDSNKNIVGYHTYLTYDSTDVANMALSYFKPGNNVSKYYAKDKYIVIEYKSDEYQNMTVEDVRSMYSHLKEVKK